MTRLLTIIADGFFSLLALMFPMFAHPRAAASDAANPLARWLGRFLLGSFSLWVLWLLNQSEVIGLRNLVTGRLNEFWLPLVAICVYAVMWLGWALYRLLNLQLPDIGSE